MSEINGNQPTSSWLGNFRPRRHAATQRNLDLHSIRQARSSRVPTPKTPRSHRPNAASSCQPNPLQLFLSFSSLHRSLWPQRLLLFLYYHRLVDKPPLRFPVPALPCPALPRLDLLCFVQPSARIPIQLHNCPRLENTTSPSGPTSGYGRLRIFVLWRYAPVFLSACLYLGVLMVYLQANPAMGYTNQYWPKAREKP